MKINKEIPLLCWANSVFIGISPKPVFHHSALSYLASQLNHDLPISHISWIRQIHSLIPLFVWSKSQSHGIRAHNTAQNPPHNNSLVIKSSSGEPPLGSHHSTEKLYNSSIQGALSILVWNVALQNFIHFCLRTNFHLLINTIY